MYRNTWRRWHCFGVLALIVASLSVHAAEGAELELPQRGKAIARVNGQPITQSVLEELAKSRVGVANPYDEATPQEEEERRKALASVDREKLLQDLVVMEVLAQKARERGLHLRTDIAAEAELQYKTLLQQHLVREMIKDIKVEQEEIAVRYAAQQPDQEYQLSHILLKDEASAKAAIAAIEKGVRFEQVAHERSLDKHSSKDGSLGWLMLNQMEEPFAAAATGLKAGEYTRKPVETMYGWHVIRLHATRDLKKPSLQDMQSILYTRILHEKVQERVRQLIKEAKIEAVRQQ